MCEKLSFDELQVRGSKHGFCCYCLAIIQQLAGILAWTSGTLCTFIINDRITGSEDEDVLMILKILTGDVLMIFEGFSW